MSFLLVVEIAFGCGYGVDRSPTAARIAQRIGKEVYGLEIKTHFLGIDDPNLEYCSSELMYRKYHACDWAFVMQESMVKEFNYLTGISLKKIRVLGVDDIYDTSIPEQKKALEDVLEKKIREELSRITNNHG